MISRKICIYKYQDRIKNSHYSIFSNKVLSKLCLASLPLFIQMVNMGMSTHVCLIVFLHINKRNSPIQLAHVNGLSNPAFMYISKNIFPVESLYGFCLLECKTIFKSSHFVYQ